MSFQAQNWQNGPKSMTDDGWGFPQNPLGDLTALLHAGMSHSRIKTRSLCKRDAGWETGMRRIDDKRKRAEEVEKDNYAYALA